MRRSRRLASVLATALAITLILPSSGLTADPPAGTVGAGNSSVSWTGVDQSAETAGPDACQQQSGIQFPPYCDDFALTVTDAGQIVISVTGTVPANDFDLYVYDRGQNLVASSAAVGSLEQATVPCATPAESPYDVRVVYFQTFATPADGDPGYTGTADFSPAAAGACDSTPAVQASFSGTLNFGPATVVSAHFLGSEPQTTLERSVPGAAANAGINPNRVFIDWPLSSRSGIGQLSRSLDGGDSFRLLLDLTCAPRSRPNCATGGGGDTEDEVNLHTGSVFFADQEVAINEAAAASFDHGDSWINQNPISAQTTATDRQWIATADDELSASVGGQQVPLEAFLTYHVPCAGQYVHGIERIGNQAQPLPQPVPQIQNVGQSGQPRVDTNQASPAHEWVYQPYNTCIGGVDPEEGGDAGSIRMATANGADYASPLSWKTNLVTTDSPDIFSWSAIDPAGNAYLVWTTQGVMYLSTAPMSDARNNPAQGGWPGSHWTPQVRVQLPEVRSAVFPEVIAGPPGAAGTIGITYDGTTTYSGLPDNAPDDTLWHTYAAVVRFPNGLDGAPVVSTGRVSHRPIHQGNICTGGTGCTGAFDRSLLDMTDIGFDDNGRLGVVFTDNRSDHFAESGPGAPDEGPFVHFAKQVTGLSMKGTALKVKQASGSCRADPSGDATWPNRATSQNLAGLDIRQACFSVKRGTATATITLSSATTAAMTAALASYNTQSQPCLEPCSAHRLQYVLRLLTGSDIYHLSAEFVPGSGLRFFGGRLDDNDKLLNPGNPVGIIGAGYHTDAGFAVTGKLSGSTLTLTTAASNLGLASGGPAYSITAFGMAGPLESEEVTAGYTMRTVDASPPFDG